MKTSRIVCLGASFSLCAMAFVMALMVNGTHAINVVGNDGFISHWGLWERCDTLGAQTRCGPYGKYSESKIIAARAFFIIEYIVAFFALVVIPVLSLKIKFLQIEKLALMAIVANAFFLLLANALQTARIREIENEFFKYNDNRSYGWNLIIPWIGMAPAVLAILPMSYMILEPMLIPKEPEPQSNQTEYRA